MATDTHLPVTAPQQHTDDYVSSASSSSSSINEPTTSNSNSGTNKHLERPKIGTRKPSGTIIVPRDDPRIEIQPGDEAFDEDDARAMSPRRNSEDLEKMSQDARAQLSQYVYSWVGFIEIATATPSSRILDLPSQLLLHSHSCVFHSPLFMNSQCLSTTFPNEHQSNSCPTQTRQKPSRLPSRDLQPHRGCQGRA